VINAIELGMMMDALTKQPMSLTSSFGVMERCEMKLLITRNHFLPFESGNTIERVIVLMSYPRMTWTLLGVPSSSSFLMESANFLMRWFRRLSVITLKNKSKVFMTMLKSFCR